MFVTMKCSTLYAFKSHYPWCHRIWLASLPNLLLLCVDVGCDERRGGAAGAGAAAGAADDGGRADRGRKRSAARPRTAHL